MVPGIVVYTVYAWDQPGIAMGSHYPAVSALGTMSWASPYNY